MRHYFSNGGGTLPYVAVTVPSEIAIHVKELAKAFGWQLADYMRTLICVGAAFFLLSFGNQDRQEAASTLLGGLKLLELSKSFSFRFSEKPYEVRIRGRIHIDNHKPSSICLQPSRCLRWFVGGFTQRRLQQMLAAGPADLLESADNGPAFFAGVHLMLRA